MELTEKQLETLRHMLGINTPDDRIPKPYRNHYAASPGNEKMAELERLGAVKFIGKNHLGSGYDFYACTDEGRLAAIMSHRTIRKKKPQRVYAKYLDVSDCFPDLTFKDFLTHPEFKQCRDEA